MPTAIQYVGMLDDGGDGAFVVIAKVAGRWYHHQGPRHYSHFTFQQAERLAARVRVAGRIDMQYWEPSWVTEAEIEERWLIDAKERR